MQIDLSIFSTKARPLIGLDISSSAVKLVELSGGGKEGYRVERYTIEVLAKDVVAEVDLQIPDFEQGHGLRAGSGATASHAVLGGNECALNSANLIWPGR